MILKRKTVLMRHFKRRVFERLGEELTTKDVELINREIRNGRTKGRAQSHSRTIHDMKIRGKRAYVIYDKFKHTVVTVLSAP